MSEKKLRVLQINKLYAPDIGGIERVAQQIAEGLKDQTQMQVLACQQKGARREEEVNGVRVIRAKTLGTKFSMPISFGLFKELRKLAKQKDVLLFHMPFPLGDLAYLFSGYKGKTIAWWHSDVVRQKKMMFFYKPIMNAFCAGSTALSWQRRGISKARPTSLNIGKNAVLFPLGSIWRNIKKTSPRLLCCKKEGQAGTVKFLFVGRLVYYKGIDVLLKAFERAENAELFIVGSGPLKEELAAEARRMGKERLVHFLSVFRMRSSRPATGIAMFLCCLRWPAARRLAWCRWRPWPFPSPSSIRSSKWACPM